MRLLTRPPVGQRRGLAQAVRQADRQAHSQWFFRRARCAGLAGRADEAESFVTEG